MLRIKGGFLTECFLSREGFENGKFLLEGFESGKTLMTGGFLKREISYNWR